MNLHAAIMKLQSAVVDLACIQDDESALYLVSPLNIAKRLNLSGEKLDLRSCVPGHPAYLISPVGRSFLSKVAIAIPQNAGHIRICFLKRRQHNNENIS